MVAVSHAHENWELDEILTTVMILPIGLVIYAKRRLDETRSEQKRGQLAEREASEMALLDPLSGLGNRRKAEVELMQALTHGASDWFSLGVEIETEAEDREPLKVDTIGLQAKFGLSRRCRGPFRCSTGSAICARIRRCRIRSPLHCCNPQRAS